jgi:hypothetical protein
MRELKREADQEIREKAYIIVEELIQLYKMTNPQFGSRSEDNKLEHARVSISLFWELFDLLGYWARNVRLSRTNDRRLTPNLHRQC